MEDRNEGRGVSREEVGEAMERCGKKEEQRGRMEWKENA